MFFLSPGNATGLITLNYNLSMYLCTVYLYILTLPFLGYEDETFKVRCGIYQNHGDMES